MMIAAFDPGRNLGVLRAPLRDKAAIIHGKTLYTARLRDTTDIGAFLKSADDPIREALHGVEKAVVEAPNTQGQNHSGIFKNCALAAHIFYWCSHMGVKAEFINLKHAKVILCDNGNAKKEHMIPAAEFQLGLSAGQLTEHEADAFGIWLVESFGIPESPSERQAKAATARRLERERLRAEKEARKLGESLKF